jgi:hypothetical protein
MFVRSLEHAGDHHRVTSIMSIIYLGTLHILNKPLSACREHCFQENILGAFFIIPKCPWKPVPPSPNSSYAAYAPVHSNNTDENLWTKR